MNNIGIIAFNSSSKSQKMLDCKFIEFINLKVTIKEKDYTQKTIEELTQGVKDLGEIPKTSQPTTQEFISTYEQMISKYKEVVVLTPSKDLSGTHQSALIAKEMLPIEKQPKIHIICTQSFALSESLASDRAIDMINEGFTADAIVDEITSLCSRITTYIIPGSFDYLKKSGRINMAQLAIGKLMMLTLLLRHKDGIAEVYKKERGFKKILKTINDEIKQNEKIKKIYISGLSPKKEQYQKLREILSDGFDLVEAEIGSVVMAAHFGEYTLGYLILEN